MSILVPPTLGVLGHCDSLWDPPYGHLIELAIHARDYLKTHLATLEIIWKTLLTWIPTGDYSKDTPNFVPVTRDCALCNTPPHKCLPDQACNILLSDIGKWFHSLSKGTLCAWFISTAIPTYVLCYYTAHLLIWKWTTKNGPKAGKTFKVPTIPTHCPPKPPRAIVWLVNTFHSFKAHLLPTALEEERIPTPLYLQLCLWITLGPALTKITRQKWSLWSLESSLGTVAPSLTATFKRTPSSISCSIVAECKSSLWPWQERWSPWWLNPQTPSKCQS